MLLSSTEGSRERIHHQKILKMDLKVSSWTIIFIYILSLMLSLHCKVTTGDASDLLSSPEGFHLRLSIIVDERSMKKNEVMKVLESANNLTSREVNIHLQLMGLILIPMPLEMSSRSNGSEIIHWMLETSPSKDYDLLMLLHSKRFDYDGPYAVTSDWPCTRFSRGLVDVQYISENKGNVSSVIAGVVLNNIYYKQSTDKCSCPRKKSCVEQQAINGSTVSDCFKNKFREKLMNKTKQLPDNPSYYCLWSPVSEKLSSKAICGNGIVESGEPCDCHYHDKGCREYCSSTCSWIKRRWTIRDHVIGGVIIFIEVLIIICLCCLTTCVHKKRRRTRNDTELE